MPSDGFDWDFALRALALQDFIGVLERAMTIRIRGVVDVDGERCYWRQADGVPGYPYSETWSLLVGIAASVFVAKPYGGMQDWLQAVRDKLRIRGEMVPDVDVETIALAALSRLDAVPEHHVVSSEQYV